MDQLIASFLGIFPACSSEVLSLLTLFVCYLFIIAFFCFYKKLGLFVYHVISILVANLHVLKHTSFAFTEEPVALGTVIFSTTFLVSDILTEFYGAKEARKTIFLGFLSQAAFMVLMLCALAHPGFSSPSFSSMDGALNLIFLPSPRFFVASLVAFAASQLCDISIFSYLSKMAQGRFLWMRQNISMILGGFIDTVVFSWLAWTLFAPIPQPFFSVLGGTVMGAMLIRFFVSLISTPFMYFLRYLYKKQQSYLKF